MTSEFGLSSSVIYRDRPRDRQTDRTGNNPHTDQTPQRESPPPKDTPWCPRTGPRTREALAFCALPPIRHLVARIGWIRRKRGSHFLSPSRGQKKMIWIFGPTPPLGFSRHLHERHSSSDILRRVQLLE